MKKGKIKLTFKPTESEAIAMLKKSKKKSPKKKIKLKVKKSRYGEQGGIPKNMDAINGSEMDYSRDMYEERMKAWKRDIQGDIDENNKYQKKLRLRLKRGR